MLIILKVVLIACLMTVAYQDIKDRQVYFLVLFCIFILSGFLNYQHNITIQFIYLSALNMGLLAVVFGILYIYSKFKLKQSLMNTFGSGDAIFFLILAVGFPTPTFVVLFVFSLFFALFAFMILKTQFKNKTIPLAGLQSVFLSLIFILNWVFNFTNLYSF